jgi:hypothetical protein
MSENVDIGLKNSSIPSARPPPQPMPNGKCIDSDTTLYHYKLCRRFGLVRVKCLVGLRM